MTRLTVEALGAGVAYSVAAGALLVAGAAAAARHPRRRSAATRHAVWTAAVLAHPLLAVLAVWVPARGATLPTLVTAVETVWPSARSGAVVRMSVREPAPGPATLARAVRMSALDARSGSPQGSPQGRSPALAPALAALWFAGALAVLLRPAIGRWHVRRIARAGVPLADGPWRTAADDVAARIGLLRRVELRRAAQPVVPMTWGIVWPTVLLPADADGWPATRRRVVLAHELAHVRRWDAATQGLARFAAAVFWFDPLVWLAVRRMRTERERACDDLALRAGLRPSEYAEELLACARALSSAWTSPQAHGALAFVRHSAAPPSEFEARVRAVLDPRQARTQWTRWQAAALAGAASTACAALASARPASAPPAAARPSAAFPLAVGTSTPRAAAGRGAGSSRSAQRAASPSETTTLPTTTSIPARDGVIGPVAAVAGATRSGDANTPARARNAVPSGGLLPGETPSGATPPQGVLRADVAAATAAGAGAAPAPPAAVSRPDPPRDLARDPLQESSATCGAADVARPGTMWVYADVPGGGRRTEYRRTAPGRCAQVAVVGSVRFDARDADVAALAPGTAVLVREVVRAPYADTDGAVADRAVADRAVRITAGPDGRPVHAYTVGGRVAGFDAAARAWLAEVAPALVREAGIDAPARVARWRAGGGVPAVLRGIAGLESTVARRAHYLALLDNPDGGGRRDAGRAALAPGEAVAEQARRDLARSPDDLRDVLARLSPQ